MTIKSIQRGTVNIPPDATSGTVTVSAVDTALTELAYLGETALVAGNQNGSFSLLEIINSTTLRATRSTAVSGGTGVTVGWQLAEWM